MFIGNQLGQAHAVDPIEHGKAPARRRRPDAFDHGFGARAAQRRAQPLPHLPALVIERGNLRGACQEFIEDVIDGERIDGGDGEHRLAHLLHFGGRHSGQHFGGLRLFEDKQQDGAFLRARQRGGGT